MDTQDPVGLVRDAVALAGSQSALARETGLAQQTFSKILSGEIRPRRGTMDAIRGAAMRMRKAREAETAQSPGNTAPGLPGKASSGAEFRFAVIGTPVAWARAGRNGARSYTPAHVRDYQNLVKHEAWLALNTRPRGIGLPAGRFTGPVHVAINVIFKPPKRLKNAMGKFKSTRPDIDNLAKSVLDALQGVLWNDDGQVASLSISKRYGERAMLTIGVVAYGETGEA